MTVINRPSEAVHHRDLPHISERLRHGSLVSTSEAGSGHPTSCLSCAEIISVIFFERMKFDPEHPGNPGNDQFVLSKGHAAPILWSAYHEAGLISFDELKSLREIDSELEGHPTPRNPWVKVATGSLGQGFSMALGMAWAARKHGSGSHTHVLLGDGETAEGSVWEAAALASYLQLGNLTAVVDVNRYGQSGETMLGRDIPACRRRFEAFGWEAREIDGHDIEAISEALAWAADDETQPRVVLAATEKGKGVSRLEGEQGSHGKPAGSLDEAVAALDEEALSEEPVGEFAAAAPVEEHPPTLGVRFELPPCDYSGEDEVATRRAFGDAMLALGDICETLVALDGDVKNSTKLEPFFDAHPERSIQCFIAEQNMLGMAIGLGKAGLLPCVATFAAFLTRAFDQLRLGAISRSRMIVAGSHCGVAIGQDGPTQMGLEDIAMMRSLPGSMVLHPADAVSTHAALEQAANHDGIAYLRLTRNKLPVIYAADEAFEPGGSKVWHESPEDRVTLVGAGVTLHECLRARETLAGEGISARVVDLFSIRPIDSGTLCRCARETGALVIAEDHYDAGGIGEAVLSALGDTACRRTHLAVRGLPRSGAPEALLDRHRISNQFIAAAAREFAA